MTYLEIADVSESALLEGFEPVERDAIIEHKYFLGIEMGFDPGIVAAVDSWVSRYAEQWRRMRMQFDCQAQMEQIHRHHERLCRQSAEHISLEQAARDWIIHYAARWRETHKAY